MPISLPDFRPVTRTHRSSSRKGASFQTISARRFNSYGQDVCDPINAKSLCAISQCLKVENTLPKRVFKIRLDYLGRSVRGNP